MRHAGIFARGDWFFDLFVDVDPASNTLFFEVPVAGNTSNGRCSWLRQKEELHELLADEQVLARCIDQLLAQALLLASVAGKSKGWSHA